MVEIIVPEYRILQVAELDFSEPAQINRSAWTGASKIIGLPGAGLWTGQVSIEALATEEAERPWRAFLSALRGQQNWFKVYFPCQTHVGAKPVVGAGAGNGYSLPLTGMTPNILVLKAGQHFSVPLPSGHVRAARLTSDIMSSPTGTATANFGPALNEVPIAGVTVETVKPYVPMRSTQARNALSYSGSVSGFSLDLVETL